MKKFILMLMLCLLFFAGSAFAVVVNVDLGNTVGTFSGQGAYLDPGNDYWHGIGRSKGNLRASDGKLSGISIDLVGQGVLNVKTSGYANDNLMLADYAYTQNSASFSDAVGDITISGLKPYVDCLLYIYSAGDNINQGGEFTLNGVIASVTGDQVGADVYVEGENYVKMEVTADANGQIIGSWTNAEGNGFGAFNGIQIVTYARGEAHSPFPAYGDPADEDDHVDPTTTTSVYWYSPEQDEDGFFADDLNIDSVDGYDVWFGTTEPNELSGAPEFTTSQSHTVDLDYGTTYYLRVDTHLTWNIASDPNISWIAADPSKGNLWQFTTRPAYLPQILTFDNSVLTALGLLPAELTASVTERTQAITSVDFTLLENEVVFPRDAVWTLTDTTGVDLTNPTAELTTDTPGTYYVNLAVFDGTTTVEAVVEVEVYADACEAKKASLSGLTANYFDTNLDCLVYVQDLADMAYNWLDDTSMAVQEAAVEEAL
jgi:hypothetical protein